MSAPRQIAALYVEEGGAYYGLPGVDPWSESRDARLYPGPFPVVAHPPCQRWCRLAGLVEARWGYRRGEDGGTFAAALAAVRRWGGVLEHPAYSDAWSAYHLPRPPRDGGWQRGICGGWSAHVEQGHYGHRARKATWLYAYDVHYLPTLRSGKSQKGGAWVSWCGNATHGQLRPRLGKRAASATPPAFRDLLMEMARSATPSRPGGQTEVFWTTSTSRSWGASS